MILVRAGYLPLRHLCEGGGGGNGVCSEYTYRTVPIRVCFTYYAMHNRYNYSIYFSLVKYFGKKF